MKPFNNDLTENPDTDTGDLYDLLYVKFPEGTVGKSLLIMCTGYICICSMQTTKQHALFRTFKMKLVLNDKMLLLELSKAIFYFY